MATFQCYIHKTSLWQLHIL